MKIRVSLLLILMVLVLCILGYFSELLCYLITIIIHEIAHAQASARLGYSLNVIKLMPYGASLTGAFEGVKRGDEVLIAMAGPVVNILVAVLFIALWWLAPVTYFYTEFFVVSNICTAVFNLLPIFPLDGGRAFLALASNKYPRERVYRVMRLFGGIAAVVFAVIFFASIFFSPNFTFASIAVFIFISTVIPDKNSKYQRLYSMAFRSEKVKSGLTVKEVIVNDDATVLQLTRMLNGNYFFRFVLVDKSFKEVLRINETELETLAAKIDNGLPIIKKHNSSLLVKK